MAANAAGAPIRLPWPLDRVQRRRSLELPARAHSRRDRGLGCGHDRGRYFERRQQRGWEPNDDNDWGYVVEMRFDLGVDGLRHHASRPATWWSGTSRSTTADWIWPFQGTIFSSNRVWWQNPWGNDFWFHNVRVMGKPSVTIASGPAPALGPDFRIRAADNYAAPIMDGT